MSEEPKKIWVDDDWEVYEIEPKYSTATPYIRADLVDGLVEALEDYAKTDEYFGRLEKAKRTRAALKALEEEDV